MLRFRTFPFSRETGRFDTKLSFATRQTSATRDPLETFNGTVLKRCVLVPLPMPLSSRAAGLCGSALAFRSLREVGVRCDLPPRFLVLLPAKGEGVELVVGDEPRDRQVL